MTALKVKICGNLFHEDAFVVASHEPDYMGWIFSPKSPRRIAPEKARDVIAAIRRTHPRIRHVGVFARNSVPDIRRAARVAELDFLQVVAEAGIGGSLRATVEALPPIVPAVRVKEKITDGDLTRHGASPFYVLDSFVPGKPGGTGKRLAPELIRSVQRPYLLAGGLRPENLLEAVRDIQPLGVDVSSGLEDDVPGRKNRRKLAEFIRLARSHHRSRRI